MSDDRQLLRACHGEVLHEYLCRVLHDANTGRITPDPDDPARYAAMADMALHALAEVLHARADWMGEGVVGGALPEWAVSRTRGVRIAAEQLEDAVRKEAT